MMYFQAHTENHLQVKQVLHVLKTSSDKKFDDFCIGLLDTEQDAIVEKYLLNDGESYVVFYSLKCLLNHPSYIYLPSDWTSHNLESLTCNSLGNGGGTWNHQVVNIN